MNKIFQDTERLSNKAPYCSINIKSSMDQYGNDKI